MSLDDEWERYGRFQWRNKADFIEWRSYSAESLKRWLREKEKEKELMDDHMYEIPTDLKWEDVPGETGHQDLMTISAPVAKITRVHFNVDCRVIGVSVQTIPLSQLPQGWTTYHVELDGGDDE